MTWFKQPFGKPENRYFQRIKDEMETTGLHAYWLNLHTYWQNCTFIKNNGAFL
jgi:hypothetical protein